MMRYIDPIADDDTLCRRFRADVLTVRGAWLAIVSADDVSTVYRRVRTMAREVPQWQRARLIDQWAPDCARGRVLIEYMIIRGEPLNGDRMIITA